MMFRVRTLRMVQRVTIFLTILCLFGSIFVLLRLFTEFDTEWRGRDKSEKIIEVGFSLKSSRIERLDSEILSRSLGRKSEKRDGSEVSSIIVRNVFGIRPVSMINISGKADKGIIQIGVEPRKHDSHKRYLFIFHHYEQFGKTTENFVQLCSIAAYGSRTVVEPFVRDSRLCGLETGWWGESLTKSRLFRPLSLYFDVQMMNELLSQNGYSTVQPFTEFKLACNKTTANLTLVHFLYGGGGKGTTKKWFNLNERQYEHIYSQSKVTGWVSCPIIDRGLNVSQRLGENMKTGRQLCVNAEMVTDHVAFEKKVLKGDKCVVVIHWKGFGINRTHFKPKVKLNAREVVHRLHHSSFIIEEADLFRRIFLEKPYIGVHVRAERQLLWYSSNALIKCINLVIKAVKNLKQKEKIDTVFLSTDLTQYGSDTLVPGSSAMHRDKNLNYFEKHLSDSLNPKKYSPNEKEPLLMDHGVVAIVEMNILSHSNHLITLGSGSFQEWVMALFVQKKKALKQDWTISRVCSKEKKIH